MLFCHTFMYKDIKNIHIGELIARRLDISGLSYAEFARRLYVDRTTIYNIIRSKSIDIDRLIKISTILDFDFISEIYMDKATLSETESEIQIDMSTAQSKKSDTFSIGNSKELTIKIKLTKK